MANGQHLKAHETAMNSKQQNECADVAGFLRSLHWYAPRIEPGDDPPDVIADVRTETRHTTIHVGIEVTRPYVDPTKSYGSFRKRLTMWWAKVQGEIERLRHGASELSDINALVTLNKSRLSKHWASGQGVSEKKFANQVVECVTRSPVASGSDVLAVGDWKEREVTDFADYPLLLAYVVRIRITNGRYGPWDADVHTAHVGVRLDQLVTRTREKNGKLKNCNRARFDELWLLSAAAADTVFNLAGPSPDGIDFENSELQEACRSGPFDRVFFWSSPPHEWVKQIWP